MTNFLNKWRLLASQEGARDRLVATLFAVVGVLLRLPHLGWGLPDIEEEALPMKKALEMWGWDNGQLQLDPQTAGWPSLSFYIHLGVQHLHYGIGRVSGVFDDRYDYLVAHAVDYGPLLLISRLVGVLAAGGVIYIGVRLATRLSDRSGAYLTGTLLVLSPMLLRHAQLVTPDILLTLFAALAIAKILDLYDRGRIRDYILAGLWIGLGVATKYTPVLLTASLFAVHLMRRRQEGRTLRYAGLDDARLWYAALACVFAFLLTSPYLLLDLDTLRRDFAYQALHMSEGHFGQKETGPGFVFYLRDVLAPGLGVTGFVLGAVGLVAAAWRWRRGWLVMLICAAPFFLVLGSLSTRFERYMLPLLMPLAVGLAAWPLTFQTLPQFTPRQRRAMAWGIGLAVFVPAAWGSWRQHEEISRPSTQQLARAYIWDDLRAENPVLAMEAYTPELNADGRSELRAHPIYDKLSRDQQQRLADPQPWTADRIKMYSTRVELAAFYYDLRHYLPYDYVVTSESVRDRYLADPERYPQQTQFYENLERYGRLLWKSPSASVRGPEIRIYAWQPRGEAALLADHGALQPDFYRPYLDRLHAPDFHAFIQAVAMRAASKEMWATAALYYEAMVETLGADVPRQARLALIERAAHSNLQAGQDARALNLANKFLELEDRSPRMHSIRAQVYEGRGELDAARLEYERTRDNASYSQDARGWQTWATAQLERLDAGGN